MDYTIQDLPKSERPREKLEHHGPQRLSDVELLSIILRTGTQGKNVKELSSEILNKYSLDEMADRDLEEMKEFDGISRVKAGQLISLGELSRRMKKEEREKIESLEDVKARTGDMKFMESEVLRVFYLNSGNEILMEEEFSGGVSEVNFEVKELFKSAMQCNASAMILSHNHPSGKASATEQDVKITENILDLGKSLGIDVLDHIVVGREFSSMRKKSKLNF